MTFKDLESLRSYLVKDSKQVSLNPVRFISVDSLSMWIEVKKILLSISDESLPLSKFCEAKDTTPNIRRMLSTIKKSDHSLFITPLSEYLRIIPEIAEETIRKIIKSDYQNNENGKARLYFLMYRIKSVLHTIPVDDPRTQGTILYLDTNEESDYKLTIVQKNLNVTLPGNTISGFKSYLEYWEANPDKPLILHTDNAIHFEKNHFFDDVRVIVTSFDLVKEQYDLPSGIQEELGTSEQWNELVKTIIEDQGFEQACCSLLSINKYSAQLFERWNSYSEFQKWILWIWSRVQNKKSYIVSCAKSSETAKDFANTIYNHIIGFVNTDNYADVYNERKQILQAMNTSPPESFLAAISELDSLSSLACLTDLTDIERKAIFEIIAGIRFESRSGAHLLLKTVYPKLFYYLNNDDMPNSAGMLPKFSNYFQEYKWLKATDTISASFLEDVKKFALEKGASVFAMPTRNSLITENYDENTSILFVDGMGIEYVDYLTNLFSDLNSLDFDVRFDAGYCTLPSITEINKDFMNGRNTVEPPIRDLDELKHANNTHPESLIKQLHILDEIKDKVLGALTGNATRIIVTADHGTSRLAVKVRGTDFDNALPKPEGISIYKYGRFCEEGLDESRFPTAININDRLIFADYSRFIQSGAPIDEIHGGASLEEWIVPVVIVEKVDKSRKEELIISPDKSRYKPALGSKTINVAFSISGKKRDSVKVNIKGSRINCSYSDGMYHFDYKTSSDETNLTVKVIDGTIIGQFDIVIEQPIKKNAKFDI